MSTQDKPDRDDGTQVVPFATVLQGVGKGAFAAKLADELQELALAVKETAKKGTLSLTLTVAPFKPGNTEHILVTGRSVLKAPERESATPTSIFYSDDAGNLTRNDPRQETLPLRGLENPRSATA
jgi:hypothetical protein